MHRTSQ
jgi:hypothetical protein